MRNKQHNWRGRLTFIGAWIVVAFLIGPMLVSVPMSLTPDDFLSMPHGTLSLQHYRTLFTDPSWLGAIRDSLIVGAGAMILALTVGAACAIGLWLIGGPVAGYLSALPMLPLIVPTIVSALALSRAALSLGMLDTFTALITAHAILGVPFVFMSVTASLEPVDKRMVQAARSLGAGTFRTIAQVIIPNIKSGLLTGAVFAFFTSWDEVVVALFVVSNNVYTLPLKIWSELRDNIDPAVAAISTLMIAATLIVATIYLIIERIRERSAKPS